MFRNYVLSNNPFLLSIEATLELVVSSSEEKIKYLFIETIDHAFWTVEFCH